MQTGSVVQPDEPRCRIPNMPVFKVGYWKGLYHSPAMLRELEKNFRTFRFWQPYGSINHEDVLACGRVTDVRFDGQTLFLDVGALPESVAKAWNAGFLHGPSIEYWDTKENQQHKLTSGFRLPDGSPPGLVLRCVTLCGNGAPAVKTLGPMPQAIYEEMPTKFVQNAVARTDNWKAFGDFAKDLLNTDPATRRFTSEDFMDKQAMIASLKAAQPWLTDELLASMSDQQLAMLLDGAQGASASGAVGDATAGGGDLGAAGAVGAPPAAGGGAPPPPLDTTKMMSEAGNDPEKMMCAAKKFMQEAATTYASAAASSTRVHSLESKLKFLEADAKKKTGTIVNDRIRQFMDGPASTRVPPAQRKFVEDSLRLCDATTIRKFADDSKMGSQLEEKMAEILKAFPVNPGFIRKFADGNDTANANGAGGDFAEARVKNTARLFSLLPELAPVREVYVKRHATLNAA